ncbi:hypothetical protein LEP1GSC059_1826 [Leptospira noguchii serovar Panama str. CZ214]|uniref:Uncharacterized protein n=1 Tax=Leptospira noguchii serovar Panama str. CZ214 TaxID=1001595 RepID=T0FJ37_9LEPT|nr:hypothetical protein LEP1GSC059_1826 [Leptospira noguchii serovar Panama str. CZ214]
MVVPTFSKKFLFLYTNQIEPNAARCSVVFLKYALSNFFHY